MSCDLFYYSGIGECKSLRESIVAMILVNKGTTITKANAATLTGWKAIVAPSTGSTGIIIDLYRGLEPASDEAEMTTSNLGLTEKTNENAPKFNGFGNMSYEDYKTLFAGEGRKFDIFLVDKMGDIVGSDTGGLNLEGFRGRFFLKSDLPKVGADRQKDMQFMVMFDDVDQWKDKTYTVKSEFKAINLIEDINPVGVTVSLVTAYASGDVVVKVTKRNNPNAPVAVFDATTNWSVLSAGDALVAVTDVDATSKALGLYTLTIQKDSTGTPADLTNDCIIQATENDGGTPTAYLTYLSQPFTVVV
jgi:hypothetical protein